MLKSHLSSDDKQTLEMALNEIHTWIELYRYHAGVNDIHVRRVQLESICCPIMMRMYSADAASAGASSSSHSRYDWAYADAGEHEAPKFIPLPKIKNMKHRKLKKWIKSL